VAATICPRPTLTFDLLTLKSVWESHVTWGTPVQSSVFLGLLVFELEPMYATWAQTSDIRQTDGRTTDADDRLMPPPPLRGRGHNNQDNDRNYGTIQLMQLRIITPNGTENNEQTNMTTHYHSLHQHGGYQA